MEISKAFFIRNMEHLYHLFYTCTGVSTDTRTIQDGDLFIALKGGNFDGNKYANEALRKGAKYAIVDDPNVANNHTIFYVPSGLTFLQQLSHQHRMKFNIPVIAITGTNGKTTTKELVANVLKQEFGILYTQGNLNNHIGVPLTLLKITNEHDIAIIEMGASKPGDIKELVNIATPTHGIITNIGIAHIEGFGGPEGVLKTKKELYDYISETGGSLFCNIDDVVLKNILPKGLEIITFGSDLGSDISGEIVSIDPEIQFTWKTSNYSSPPIKTHLIGNYNFTNILAAICIGHYFELSSEQINNGISSYSPKNNRSQVKRTSSNTLILDAYNANPSSVKSALESFDLMQGQHKMVVLGDMLELGSISKLAHKEVIELVLGYNFEAIFIGEIYASFKPDYSKGMFFEDIEDAKLFISLAQPKNNIVLLKGSRGIGLERLEDLF